MTSVGPSVLAATGAVDFASVPVLDPPPPAPPPAPAAAEVVDGVGGSTAGALTSSGAAVKPTAGCCVLPVCGAHSSGWSSAVGVSVALGLGAICGGRALPLLLHTHGVRGGTPASHPWSSFLRRTHSRGPLLGKDSGRSRSRRLGGRLVVICGHGGGSLLTRCSSSRFAMERSLLAMRHARLLSLKTVQLFFPCRQCLHPPRTPRLVIPALLQGPGFDSTSPARRSRWALTATACRRII